jgi:hypothetical protein
MIPLMTVIISSVMTGGWEMARDYLNGGMVIMKEMILER